MKISSAMVHDIRIPMQNGSARGWGNNDWPDFKFLLLEIKTDAGMTGWGEAWAYSAWDETYSALKFTILPQVIDQEVINVSEFTDNLLRKNPVGETGASATYAISAVNIALWDIWAKQANKPLHRLLGDCKHDRLPVFASFFRFDDPDVTGKMCKRALSENMCWLKLHEVREDCVKAAREAAPDIPLILDVSHPWTPDEAVEMVRRLQDYDLYWIEEPIHPPQDIESLGLLKFSGIPIGIGENAYTVEDFENIMDSGLVDFLQPGIPKMGGIGQVQKVLELAHSRGHRAIPFTPFHGPAMLASLHLLSTLSDSIPVEFFYYTHLEAHLYGDALSPRGGISRRTAITWIGIRSRSGSFKQIRFHVVSRSSVLRLTHGVCCTPRFGLRTSCGPHLRCR